MSHWVQVIALLAVTFAAARLSRLIVHDKYPPVAWIRDRWRAVTHDGPWSTLVDCHFCVSPYVAAALWWPLYGSQDWPFGWYIAILMWLAIAYLAAIIVSYDGG